MPPASAPPRAPAPGSDALRDGRRHRGRPVGPAVGLLKALARTALVGVLALFLLLAVRAGLAVGDALRGLAVVGVTQIVPGVLVWRCVRPRQGWWAEDVGLGFGVGICLAVAAQTAAGLLQLPWLAALPGPALAAVLLLLPRSRRRVLAARTTPLPWGWSAAVAGVVLLQLTATASFYRTIPLSWAEGFRSTYVDIPFHQALAGQLAHRGPVELPFVLGEGLQYHWFSHAWIAQVAVVGGVPVDAVLVRLLPALITVLATLAVAAAAVRIVGRAWAGPLAALLAVAAGDLDVFGGARPGLLVLHLSPSTSLSVPLLAALLALLVCRWRAATALPGSLLVLVVLAFTAAGMKGSALPVVVAGAAAAGAVAVVGRAPHRRRVVLDGVVLTAVFLVALTVIFRGGSQGLALDPAGAAGSFAAHLGISPEFAAATLPATAGLAVLTLVAALARGAGLLALASTRDGVRDPVVWLLLGCGLAGAGAVLLLSHAGQSQLYFLRSAGPALAIGSAAGVLRLLDLLGPRALRLSLGAVLLGAVGGQLAPLLLGAVDQLEDDAAALRTALLYLAAFVVIVAVGTLVLARRERRRGTTGRAAALAVATLALLSAAVAPVLVVQTSPAELAPPAGPVAPDERFAISADQVEAARWIRDNSDPDDVVVTNRHCSAPNWVNCDSRRFHLAAYTERRVLVEGWAYAQTWADAPDVELGPVYKPFWDPARLSVNDRFLSRPTARLAEQLHDLGARWAFVDLTVDGAADLGAHAELRLETQWARVYELQPPADRRPGGSDTS